ncbi:glycoside hydrolase family 27 protein [Granulicella sibirica]|uniref:Alpha-galactosidase n=1 Tax=Granulicella sibirica TaxID=2479048 RepID=A0A4Q0SYV5_9BACT|nr:glycoside hydrolase family 27 protein [Granulicella sibirica]RXH54391.1 Alpha-galactosidase precursor [Granulicella sibirica]
MKPILRALALLLLASPVLPAQAQKLAATPPMGWNSWNYFAGRVTDKDIRDTADLLVSTGMRDAGYIYVNIDDTWEGERDAQGIIHTNKKFPDMKALSDYVHSKGLKLGIYSSPGAQTCAHYAGSLDHEQQDAQTYADWGIDYLKYDLCGFREKQKAEAPNDLAKQNKMMRDAYMLMHQAILKTGRPMVYSLCQYGFDAVWDWGPEVGANSWRTTGDINATYDRMIVIGLNQAGLGKFAGPGHWNDPDMLEVGNGKLTMDENRFHMTLWAMLASPLLAGNDLTKMTPEVASILMNKQVVAIDQDPLGHQAERVYAEGPIEFWSRPLADGSTALAIFNTGEDPSDLRNIPLPLKQLGFNKAPKAHDLWLDKSVTLDAAYKPTLPRHSTILLKLTK